MSDNQILITGGLGQIGSHSVFDLLTHGKKVVIVDNLCNSSIGCLNRLKKLTNQDIPFHQIDITNKEELSKIFNEYKFDGVIHFAALKAVKDSQSNPCNYYRNNILSTLNLIELCNSHNVFNFILSSTACVYGNNPLCKESDKVDCENVQGRTKYMCEQLLADNCAANKRFNATVLRQFNVIGNHPEGLLGEVNNGVPDNLLPQIQRVAIGKYPQLTIFGKDWNTPDGTCVRDYIHVMDLVEGHRLVFDSCREMKLQGINIQNLGTGQGYSVLELVTAFIEQNNKQDFKQIYDDRRNGDVEISTSCVDKIFNELGWKAKYGVNDMVRHSWLFIKNNPDGYID